MSIIITDKLREKLGELYKNAGGRLIKLFRPDPFLMPQLCYGQNGEDLVLDRLLAGKKDGFFVDVGAHHPARFSNTYLFYRRGWMGINIDAQPGGMTSFNKLRPRDINLEQGIAGHRGQLTYYRFNEPALNTFDPDEAKRVNHPPYHLVDEILVNVCRLDELLDSHLPPQQEIDFLSIDVEGKDREVLESNNWERYRPRFVLAEEKIPTTQNSLSMPIECQITKWMQGVDYRQIGKVYNTIFFERKDRE